MNLSTSSSNPSSVPLNLLSKDRLLTAFFIGVYLLLCYDFFQYPSWRKDAILIILLTALYCAGKNHRKLYRMILPSVFIFLLVGEIFFRLFYFGPEALIRFLQYNPAPLGHPVSSLIYDPATYTGLKTGQSSYFKGKTFQINEIGFRDRERSREKRAGTFRILILGTSLSMGMGVDQNETYAAHLEELLNKRGRSGRFEVLNLARGAYGVDDMIDVLERYGMPFDPDLILIEPRWTSRGLHPIPPIKTEPGIWGTLKKYFSPSGLTAFSFFYQAVRHEYIPQIKREFSQSIAPLLSFLGKKETAAADLTETIENYLIRIKAITRDVPTGIITLRPMELLQKPFEANAAARALFAKYGFLNVDTSHENYGLVTSDRIIFPGDHHPNAEAHRIYAGSILKHLKTAGLIRD